MLQINLIWRITVNTELLSKRYKLYVIEFLPRDLSNMTRTRKTYN